MQRLSDSELSCLVKEYEETRERLRKLDAKISWELNIRLTERLEKGPIERLRPVRKNASHTSTKPGWKLALGI